MNAMPLMIVVLCAMAIAYRYYSAFLAARVAVLYDGRVVRAEVLLETLQIVRGRPTLDQMVSGVATPH
jgi:carbon starvation protein CstA